MMMNFLDLSAASDEERRLIRDILSDTSVVNIAEPQQQQQQQQQSTSQPSGIQNESLQTPVHQNQPTQQHNHHHHHQHHMTNTPAPMYHHHLGGQQRQTFKTTNFSNSGHNNHNGPASGSGPLQNHRNSYNSQRKNVHSSHNINSISNGSGNNRGNNRLSNFNNIGGLNNVQTHYPQQYTPPLPSNASNSNHYHSNIIVNNHSANALNSQLNQLQQHQRTNEISNERLRNNIGDHIISDNDINIVAANSPGSTSSVIGLDQHNGSTMPLNVYNHHTAHMHHQVPPVMQTAKLDTKSGNPKNQIYHSQDTSNIQPNTNAGTQPVPTSAQMPSMSGDMNSVIGMDMASSQQPGYAIPPHVQAFAPPPHHVYGGPPLFQPYNYLIYPYNLQSYVPYVLPPNPVVPPRQQGPPLANQSTNTTTSNSSHPRSHSHHMQHQQQPHINEQYINAGENSGHSNQKDFPRNAEPRSKGHNSLQQLQYLKKNSTSERGFTESQKEAPVKVTQAATDDTKFLQQEPEKSKKSTHDGEPIPESNNRQPEGKSVSNDQNNDALAKPTPNAKMNTGISIVNKIKIVVPSTRVVRTESQVDKKESEQAITQPATDISQPIKEGIKSEIDRKLPPTSSATATNPEDVVKFSSDEGFETQSSLDLSKQSHESSFPASDQSKSSPENCNKLRIEDDSQLSPESQEMKSGEVTQRATGALGSASSKSWADLFKRGGSASGMVASLNGDTEDNMSESEYSDEDGRTQRSLLTKVESGSKLSATTSTSKEQRSQDVAKRAQDKMALRLAQKITSINLKHALPFLKPRGFINKGNGCYINATLQALIACPPFYNLMKEIGDLRICKRDNSCTPIIDSFAELFLNFPPLDNNKKNKQSAPQEQKLSINHPAEAIEPKCIYNVLGQIKAECLKGAQEDVEEFLSSVLNGLHEEMIGLGEIMQSAQDSRTHNGHQSDVEDSNDDIANDDNLWREVGPKNRSLPIRTAKVINTPIQEIFGGSLFSIRTAGKDRCGHRSPFFDLQLDISNDNVKSVEDAIRSFTATEVIHDFVCTKTKQKLDAQRRTSLDQLPPILILHLKQFVYTQNHGQKKLMKKIEFPIDFEIHESCLHEKISNDRNLRVSRSYKLLAVVYHDGKEAIKGHYLTDVYHIGSSQWIRCDDSNLKVIPSPRIENPDSTRTPYLLFYRRLNTLRAQTSNHDNKKKS